MSNIPAARKWLKSALESHRTKKQMRVCIGIALQHMHRKKPAKPVARKNKESITPACRRLVKRLAAQGVSNFEITKRAKLHNSGRVTDILQGRR